MNRGFNKTRNTKLIVTIGPATKSARHFRIMKDKGVDFLRINMSHSSIEDFSRAHMLAREVGIDYIIDTEGPQIRTACLNVILPMTIPNYGTEASWGFLQV